MPQVPYSPTGNAIANETLPNVRANVPAEAFGGNVALAIQGMGREVAGAGEAIYKRAMFLQDLNNQAEAKTAEAEFMIESGKLHARFNTMEGSEAVRGYGTYTEELRSLRQRVSDKLSTSDARRVFDNNSLGTMSRAIMNGASHLASQQKAYVVQSADAELTAVRETVAQNPNDERGFAEGLARTEATTRGIARLRGVPPEAADNAVRNNTSALWASKIASVAKDTPFQAVKLLEESRKHLTEKDFLRVETIVNNQRDAVGSAQIASDLLRAHINDEGGLTVSMDELQTKARDLARKFSPDDPAFELKTLRALSAEYNQVKYAKKQERRDNLEIVQGGFQSGARNMQELLTDEKVSTAFYSLPKSDQNKVDGALTRYIMSRDKQQNDESMTRLKGMSTNDVEGFLNLDPTDSQYKLSQPQIRQVMDWQAKLKKQTAQDPRVDRAMGWMRGAYGAQMEAMGVFRRTQQNKEDYDHLTGAVQSALDIWVEDKKKPPTNKEFLEQIAPNILKTTKEPGMFGIYGYGIFGTDRRVYKHDTGSAEYERFVETQKADIAAKGGSEPSDQELYKAYTRTQLLKLFPPKRKSEGGGIGSK